MGLLLAVRPPRNVGGEVVSEKLYTAADLAHWYQAGVTHERERAAGAWHEHQAALGSSQVQVAHNRYEADMRLYARCAQEFWTRELGKPYVEFAGVQA